MRQAARSNVGNEAASIATGTADVSHGASIAAHDPRIAFEYGAVVGVRSRSITSERTVQLQ